jgi:glyoxylase-like metal-dependent hydrolase (beta-lactamase superfamily II)
MKKMIALILFGIIAFTGCQKLELRELENTGLKGSVTVLDFGEVTIHSYMSGPKSSLNTTQIIETKNKLVVIDAQFVRPFAKEVVSYIKSLKKPVERVIVSHAHPDHWYGLEFFQDYPIYSLKETRQVISKVGDAMIKANKPRMGDMITDIKVVPSHIVKEGKDTIDGLEYVFKKVVDAEAGVQLVIKIPKLKVLIGQDLFFKDTHLFIGQGAFDGWLKVLNELKKDKNNRYIFVGHGKPTDNLIFDDMIEYITTAKEIYSRVNNGKELKKQLVAKYPDLKAAFMLDISNKFLYKKK